MAGKLRSFWGKITRSLRFTGPQAGFVAVPVVQEALEAIRLEGIPATTEPYRPTTGTPMERALLARFTVRRVSERLPGGGVRDWEILVLSQDVVIPGPGPGQPGRDAFVQRAVDAVLQSPIRTVVPDDEFIALVTVLDAEQRRAVAAKLHEIAAAASLREASDRVDRESLRFLIPGGEFEFQVRESPRVAEGAVGEARVRLVDRRSAAMRDRQLARHFTRRRVRIPRAAERQMRALTPEVQAQLEAWLQLAANRRATAEQLGLPPNPPPALRGVMDLGPAHSPGVAGVAQGGRLQAVVIWTPKAFELRIGFSTSRNPYWKHIMDELEQGRFKAGRPGAGHFAPEFKTRAKRRLGFVMLLGWQAAAGLQEASNSGHIAGLTQRLGIDALALASAALFIPLGQLISGLVAKRLLARGVGTRPLVMIAALGYAGLWLAGLAQPGRFALVVVMAGWFLFGLSNGFADVPIAAIADRLNQGSQRGQFAALGFAAFTLASILGSGVTVILVARHVALVPHMAVVWGVGVLLTLVTLLGPNLKEQPGVRDVRPRTGGRTIALVVLVSAAALMPLGAVYVGGPLALEHLGAAPGVAAVATFAFTGAGGVVQLLAFLAQKSRPRGAVVWGALAALAGAGAIFLSAFDTSIPKPVRIGVALLAFLVVGAGLQLPPSVLPETVGKLARLSGRSPIQAQANVTLANYMALGIGQVLLGGTAAVVTASAPAAKTIALPLAAALLFAVAGAVMAAGALAVPRR